jgi:hypothetical protein
MNERLMPVGRFNDLMGNIVENGVALLAGGGYTMAKFNALVDPYVREIEDKTIYVNTAAELSDLYCAYANEFNLSIEPNKFEHEMKHIKLIESEPGAKIRFGLLFLTLDGKTCCEIALNVGISNYEIFGDDVKRYLDYLEKGCRLDDEYSQEDNILLNVLQICRPKR